MSRSIAQWRACTQSGSLVILAALSPISRARTRAISDAGYNFWGVLKVFKNASSAPFVRASVTAVLSGAAMLLCSSALFAADAAKKDDTKKDEDQELSEVQV